METATIGYDTVDDSYETQGGGSSEEMGGYGDATASYTAEDAIDNQGPSDAHNSVAGGLGQIGSGLLHAGEHFLEGVGSAAVMDYHAAEAIGDVFTMDSEAAAQRIDEASEARRECLDLVGQAVEDIWG